MLHRDLSYITASWWQSLWDTTSNILRDSSCWLHTQHGLCGYTTVHSSESQCGFMEFIAAHSISINGNSQRKHVSNPWDYNKDFSNTLTPFPTCWFNMWPWWLSPSHLTDLGIHAAFFLLESAILMFPLCNVFCCAAFSESHLANKTVCHTFPTQISPGQFCLGAIN